MQRNLYGPAERYSQHVAPFLGAAAGYMTPNNPYMGMMLGGAAGGLSDIGRLLPELDASRRGLVAMMRSSLPMREKIKNSLSMVPHFMSYAANSMIPSATTGAMGSLTANALG
jgi:hypothetical protein